ncbi:MAG: cytochrome c3 family protein [Deltaproteobacteria bacterium]|nr:cytochrome c3 family protein [Deltaproteobacteria bacterium]
MPIVFYFGASAPTEYLAGGNFWWVKEGLGDNDTKGHNVFEDEDDEDLSAGAPGDSGFASCGTNPCHLNLSRPADIGMAELDGKYGCEGCHLNVRHHANDHPNGESGLVNSADQGWYRFLSGHMSGNGQGVEGYEDGHWEAGQPDLARGQANNHNEYLGFQKDGNYYGFALGHTTTAFCTGCHGAFHQLQYSSGSWVRHPSDAVIPDTAGSEYADTGGASHEYDPLSPVASPAVDGTPDGTVTPGTDFVMCLSCHRPHGSPYPDMLRWDYSQQIAGSDPGEGTLDQGCFYCHTKKDN